MANSANDITALLRMLRERGATAARELYESLGISQPSFSRLVSEHTEEVLALGRGRATRYALPRAIAGIERDIPLFEIDEHGSAHQVGTINPLHGGGVWVERNGVGTLYEGLPYFLDDIRPQGFLGRAFAIANQDLNLPDRIIDWNDDHVLRVLALRGEDTVGNLLIGNGSLQRLIASITPLSAISKKEQPDRFDKLAVRATEGQPVESSAGGERAKFITYIEQNDGRDVHAIVKFSPPTNTEVGVRWSDLLICEAIASEVMRDAGIPAAHARIVSSPARTYLVVERFDRVGMRGRVGVVSMGALDDYHFGKRDNYSAAWLRLQKSGLISKTDASRIQFAHAFGMLIGNSDMHFGNLSFFIRAHGGLDLAPVYDMLPMMYAPVNDQVIQREFTIPKLPAEARAAWQPALLAAEEFLARVIAADTISKDFRNQVRANAKRIGTLRTAASSVLSQNSILLSGNEQAPGRARRRTSQP